MTGVEYGKPTDELQLLEQVEKFDYERIETRSQSFEEGREIVRREWPKIQDMMDDKERQVAAPAVAATNCRPASWRW